MRCRFLTSSMVNHSILRVRNQTERRIATLEGGDQPIITLNQGGVRDGLARDPMEHPLKGCHMGLSELKLTLILP